jgi:hypothetical protein
MKNDIYDETIAYFVIKSGVFKITIQEIEKPRIMKSYEHFSPECVYVGHGTDFAITDFRQVDKTHMVILTNRWIRIIEMFTSVKICTFKDL